jgi:hypothetical protein
MNKKNKFQEFINKLEKRLLENNQEFNKLELKSNLKFMGGSNRGCINQTEPSCSGNNSRCTNINEVACGGSLNKRCALIEVFS